MLLLVTLKSDIDVIIEKSCEENYLGRVSNFQRIGNFGLGLCCVGVMWCLDVFDVSPSSVHVALSW